MAHQSRQPATTDSDHLTE